MLSISASELEGLAGCVRCTGSLLTDLLSGIVAANAHPETSRLLVEMHLGARVDQVTWPDFVLDAGRRLCGLA